MLAVSDTMVNSVPVNVISSILLQTAELKDVAKKAEANGKEVDNLTDKVKLLEFEFTHL